MALRTVETAVFLWGDRNAPASVTVDASTAGSAGGLVVLASIVASSGSDLTVGPERYRVPRAIGRVGTATSRSGAS